jgi:hypothetical protein
VLQEQPARSAPGAALDPLDLAALLEEADDIPEATLVPAKAQRRRTPAQVKAAARAKAMMSAARQEAAAASSALLGEAPSPSPGGGGGSEAPPAGDLTAFGSRKQQVRAGVRPAATGQLRQALAAAGGVAGGADSHADDGGEEEEDDGIDWDALGVYEKFEDYARGCVRTAGGRTGRLTAPCCARCASGPHAKL